MRPSRQAACHPDRRHYGHGQCWQCWRKEYKKGPVYKACDKRRKHTESYKAYQRYYHAKWLMLNPQRRKQHVTDYYKRQSEQNVQFKIKTRLRARLSHLVSRRGMRKCGKLWEMTGCTADFLSGFLEAQFQKGMTWGNMGEWHIDHVIPCAEFDLRDISQQKRCFHYTNLRPRWALDNLRKGTKCPPVHQWGLL